MRQKGDKRVIMVLKYPNCLNELYVTSSATAPTAICVNKWTGLTFFLKPQHAPVSSISRLQFTLAPLGKAYFTVWNHLLQTNWKYISLSFMIKVKVCLKGKGNQFIHMRVDPATFYSIFHLLPRDSHSGCASGLYTAKNILMLLPMYEGLKG